MKLLLKYIIRDLLAYLVLCAGIFLMLRIITEHFSFQPDAGFLQTKQAYIHNKTWLTAFYTHVFTSILTLIAGLTQFSSLILKEYRPLHRVMGKIYVGVILFVNFPAGMIMAFYANGELPSRIAFVLLDCLWFWFTLKALMEIKKGNIKRHKEFMIRSYALTFSAITLRTWKLVLSSLFTIDALMLYQLDAWLGFVPNLLLAEWLIRRKRW